MEPLRGTPSFPVIQRLGSNILTKVITDLQVLMRAGKYNDDVEILLGFNEEEGHMVTSIFEAFPLLYSAMAAGWPILGESSAFAKPLFSDDSCCTSFLHTLLFPGPFTLLNKHHTEILPIDNTMANTILMVGLCMYKTCLTIDCDRNMLAMCPRSRRRTCSRSPTCSRTASSATASVSSSTTICQR